MLFLFNRDLLAVGETGEKHQEVMGSLSLSIDRLLAGTGAKLQQLKMMKK